jgi:AraC family transcriptional regulator
MSQSRAFGQGLAACFRLVEAPAFVSRSLRHSTVAVTHIDCDIENNGLTQPLMREDALLITLQLRDCPEHDLWIDGKPMPTAYLSAGTTCAYDLRSSPVANSISPFRQIHFFLPHSALAAVDEDLSGPQVDLRWHNPGFGMDDAVIRGLGLSLLPAFDRPDEVSTLFVDHVTTAAAAYVSSLFGSAGRTISADGGLTPVQLCRAKELLRSRLDGSVSVASLAHECGRSRRGFSKAFQKATGRFPHQWQNELRVERAQALLGSNRSLSSIAATCGFASAAHLTRELFRLTGRESHGDSTSEAAVV